MNGRRAWLYCRVAHLDTFASEIQRDELQAYAKTHGFEIVGITAEYASGRDNSREGLAEVFNAADGGQMDVLLVKSISRLSRNVTTVDACLRRLKKQHVKVICTNDTVPQPLPWLD